MSHPPLKIQGFSQKKKLEYCEMMDNLKETMFSGNKSFNAHTIINSIQHHKQLKETGVVMDKRREEGREYEFCVGSVGRYGGIKEELGDWKKCDQKTSYEIIKY